MQCSALRAMCHAKAIATTPPTPPITTFPASREVTFPLVSYRRFRRRLLLALPIRSTPCAPQRGAASGRQARRPPNRTANARGRGAQEMEWCWKLRTDYRPGV